MFKFLRKYNKLILAVGGTLLLIVFLIPQAIQGLSQQAASRGAVVATVDDGEEVSSREWDQVQGEVRFMLQTGRTFLGLGAIDEPQHWYLLVREAQEAGLVGLSPRSLVQDESQLALVAQRGGVNVAFAERALARIMAVENMLQLYVNAGKLSDRRLKREAERMLHQVQATLVVIEADPDQVDATFSAEELEAQYELYKNILPDEGETPFGYKLPDRVKIEWIAVRADSVRAVVAADEEATAGVALRRHWREYENTDGLPPVSSAGGVPDIVREHLIDQITAERLDDIAKWATNELQEKRRRLPQRAGYVELPEDWDEQMLGLPVLAEGIRDRYGIELPAYHATGDEWLTPGELGDLEGIGSATTDKFGNPVSLPELAAVAKEFGGSTAQFVQEDVAGPPMRGSDGSVYVFRLTDTDPTRDPRSLDEVRDQVVDDLRRQAHFEELSERVTEIAGQAQTGGLLSVAMDHDTIVQFRSQVSLTSPFGPGVTPLPVIGAHEGAVERIIDHALTLPRDRRAQDLPLTQRVIAFPVEDRLAVVVARIDRQVPLTQPSYRQLADSEQLHALIRLGELDGGQALEEAFSYEALAERHKFVFRPRQDDEDEQGDGEQTPTQTAAADAS